MDFRAAIISDASLLANLNRQLIEDEQHRNAMSVEQLSERMAGWLAGDYRAVLFWHESEIVGYVLFRRERDFIYIRQFFVARQHRRRGIGRAAIEWLGRHEWADTPRVRLDVLVGNERAIAFWRAVGFRDYCLTMEASSVESEATVGPDRL